MNRKKTTVNIGHNIGRVLFDIANIFNLSKVARNSNYAYSKPKFHKDDLSALKSDWESVGKDLNNVFSTLENAENQIFDDYNKKGVKVNEKQPDNA